MATRRAFLAGIAAASLPRIGWAALGSPAFLAAGKLGAGYALHGLSAQGESLFQIPLPARGHAAACHPTDALAVAFARRPGTFALVLDCASGTVRHQLAPPQGRQFNGHGTFNADGSLLLTSEVVADGSAGRIGLWETDAFTRIGEWDSHGIGPHDILHLPDGRLMVANGGIQTDPADRTKLNLDSMQPNLSVLTAAGQLDDQATLPEMAQNSIRHLARVAGGVAFALQWQGDPAQDVPLAGIWRPGRAPQLCPARPQDAPLMQGYAGSIAVHPTDGTLAITSAPGGVMMFFDATGQHIATQTRADISGVAAHGGGFVATDGQGVVWACTPDGLLPIARHQTQWDNHLVALTPRA